MRTYFSYDVEIYEDAPEEGEFDFTKLTPSIGAWSIGHSEEDVRFYHDNPYMSRETAQKLVNDMLELHLAGNCLFGWNTLSFDLRLLALYSGEIEKCARLALNHVDGMFLVVAHKGYFLGLDKALTGAGITGKLHVVQLNDGTTISDMSGAKAPLLWRNLEFSAVKEYLTYDVLQPLKLAYHIEKTGEIKWTSNTGKPQKLSTKMLTVKEALQLPYPNTSWMTDPKPRWKFYDWIPKDILESEGIVTEKKNELPDLSDLDDLPF